MKAFLSLFSLLLSNFLQFSSFSYKSTHNLFSHVSWFGLLFCVKSFLVYVLWICILVIFSEGDFEKEDDDEDDADNITKITIIIEENRKERE